MSSLIQGLKDLSQPKPTSRDHAPARQVVACLDCKLFHELPHGAREAVASAQGFFDRHPRHRVAFAPQLAQGPCLPAVQGRDWHGNADVKQAFGGSTTFTITNANLASSPTAGWQSNAIDNTSLLFLDVLISIELASVATAPANSKTIFLFAFGLTNPSASAYTSNGAATPSGSEGTLTFPDVTANPIGMPLLGTVPYPITTTALNGGPFELARCFGNVVPPKFGVGMVNHSGMTLSVTAIRYNGVYNTVI